MFSRVLHTLKCSQKESWHEQVIKVPQTSSCSWAYSLYQNTSSSHQLSKCFWKYSRYWNALKYTSNTEILSILLQTPKYYWDNSRQQHALGVLLSSYYSWNVNCTSDTKISWKQSQHQNTLEMLTELQMSTSNTEISWDHSRH